MDKKGFTLIEIVVVMAMFAIITSFAVFVSMGNLQGSNFRNERSRVISALYKARSAAINNVCLDECTGGKPHGIHFEDKEYTIFQGDDWDSREPSRDVVFEISGNISISGDLEDVIFDRLSGNVTVDPADKWTLSISDDTGHTSDITFNIEGQIQWTN